MSIFQFNAINKKCQSHRPGFLLIELLVALLLMGLFMFVVTGYQNIIIRWMFEARSRIVATNRASSCLEKIASGGTGFSELCQNDSHSITVKAYPFQAPYLPRGFIAPQVTMVSLAIEWEGFEGKRNKALFSTITDT